MNVTLKQKLPQLKQKAAKAVELAGLKGRKAQVVGVVDISGSMKNLYKNHGDDGSVVQQTAQRLFALGLQFDDDGEIPLYFFGEDARKMGVVAEADCHICIDNSGIARDLEYDTLYAKPIQLVARDHYPQGFQTQKSGGFLGIGGSMSTSIVQLGQPVIDPVFVIFITDGNNNDRSQAEHIIRETSKLPIFWQFVGIGGASFDFLRKLDDMEGRFIDNAGFCNPKGDIDNMSDEDLYAELLNEFPEYLRSAQKAGLVA